MALSYERFMELTGAELVCGNIIVGAAATRRKVGEISEAGVFVLNDQGNALVADLQEAEKAEKEAAKAAKAAKAEKVGEAKAPASQPPSA